MTRSQTFAAVAIMSAGLGGCGTTKTVYVSTIPDLPLPDARLLTRLEHPRCVRARGAEITVLDLVKERDCFRARAQVVEARFNALADSVLDAEKKIQALRESAGKRDEVPPRLPPDGLPTS